ncbi:MAG: TVP38/TMEM64 family protein [Candidatus Yonathbacteria bacterium]|nr:TVP38/TMEM64 family protein [Candidatus Yonathbacteria bacterium]
MHDKKRLRAIVGVVAVAMLFIGASVFSQLYGDEIRGLAMYDDTASKLAYIFVTIIAVVFAPISTLPFLPVVSHLWGWVWAGTLSVIGWTIGAQIAFILARRLGRPFVEKIFSFKKLRAFENRLTDRNIFLTVVFLRMIIPVDVLSYSLGLFSEIKSTPFFFATLVGVIPFALIFAYTGGLSPRLQIVIITEIIAVLGIVAIVRKVIHRRK